MDTNIPGVTSSIWQNHCNGSTVGSGSGGSGGSSSSGTSQSSPINDLSEQQQPMRKKTSWSELKESVTELRKQLSRLSTMVPMNIQFRKLSDSRIRIYFLGMCLLASGDTQFKSILSYFFVIYSWSFHNLYFCLHNRDTAKWLGNNTFVHRHYTRNAISQHTRRSFTTASYKVCQSLQYFCLWPLPFCHLFNLKHVCDLD